MVSRSAHTAKQVRADRLARMTPTERVELAFKLGEQGLAAYMATHGVDRQTAMARIRVTRRLGRRPSACADVEIP
jgi:hypothetical protein